MSFPIKPHFSKHSHHQNVTDDNSGRILIELPNKRATGWQSDSHHPQSAHHHDSDVFFIPNPCVEVPLGLWHTSPWLLLFPAVSHHCCNSVCIVLEGNIMITTRLGIWDNGPCYAMSFVQSTTGHAASIKFHTEVQPTKAQHISESQKRNPTPRSAMKIKVSLFSSFFLMVSMAHSNPIHFCEPAVPVSPTKEWSSTTRAAVCISVSDWIGSHAIWCIFIIDII